MTRFIKRGGKVWIRVFPDKPITKKPPETRMGKGKGAPEAWVAVVRPGKVLFEMEGVSLEMATEAMRLAAMKLSVPTKFVSRESKRRRHEGGLEYMKAEKIRGIDVADSSGRCRTRRSSFSGFRFQMGMGQSEGLKKYRALKKDRARMLTVLKEEATAARRSSEVPARASRRQEETRAEQPVGRKK